jgi:hypothetical protein
VKGMGEGGGNACAVAAVRKSRARPACSVPKEKPGRYIHTSLIASFPLRKETVPHV